MLKWLSVWFHQKTDQLEAYFKKTMIKDHKQVIVPDWQSGYGKLLLQFCTQKKQRKRQDKIYIF